MRQSSHYGSQHTHKTYRGAPRTQVLVQAVVQFQTHTETLSTIDSHVHAGGQARAHTQEAMCIGYKHKGKMLR
jgi:hypothetical protein